MDQGRRVPIPEHAVVPAARPVEDLRRVRRIGALRRRGEEDGEVDGHGVLKDGIAFRACPGCRRRAVSNRRPAVFDRRGGCSAVVGRAVVCLPVAKGV
eukprot:3682421-Prymnesium_polylepis.1